MSSSRRRSGRGPRRLSRAQIRRWASAYIAAESLDRVGTDHPLWWSVERFLLCLERVHPEDCWSAILEILSRKPSQEVLGALAAGGLEDLIADHGQRFIARIERRARADAAFRNLLRGTWRCGGSLETWCRILAARGGESSKRGARALARTRAICLSLPDATEVTVESGNLEFHVAGVTFARLEECPGHVSVRFKLRPREARAALRDPRFSRVEGRPRGWLRADATRVTDWKQMRRMLLASYRLQAPKIALARRKRSV